MISDIKKGTDFKGLIKYVEKKIEQGKGQYIGDNFISSDRQERIDFLNQVASRRPNLSKKVFHVSLSLPEGEKLDNEKWHQLADRYMNKMGFGNAPYCITRHMDTDNDHIHIVASRVDFNGQTVSDSQDRQRSMAAVRELEILFELTRVETKRQKNLSMDRKEIHAKRRKKPLLKTQVREMVDHSIKKAISLLDLEKMLPIAKIHRYRNGKAYGISFEYQGKKFKGSQLGKGYTVKQLELKCEQNAVKVQREHQIALAIEKHEKLEQARERERLKHLPKKIDMDEYYRQQDERWAGEQQEKDQRKDRGIRGPGL
jgi:hypothetical protein